MALSSSKSYRLMLPYLLRDVTLANFSKVDSLSQLLEKSPELGNHIKHLTKVDHKQRMDPKKDVKMIDIITKAWDRISRLKQRETSFEEVMLEPKRFILENCRNLETLVLVEGMYALPLRGLNWVPFPFFSGSLKRFVSVQGPAGTQISCQNVIWVLSFCTSLQEAALSFSINLESFNYLTEFLDTFRGLSKIRKLAIEPVFLYDSFVSNEGVWKGRLKKERKMFL